MSCVECVAGIRQFHFNAWNDPNGTLAKSPAGLKLAGANATLDSRYTYFGAIPAPLYCFGSLLL